MPNLLVSSVLNGISAFTRASLGNLRATIGGIGLAQAQCWKEGEEEIVEVCIKETLELGDDGRTKWTGKTEKT